MPKKKDLVQIIKNNPGCIATIDNDCWWIHSKPSKPLDKMTDDEYWEWNDNCILASDDEVESIGSGYGAGPCYGGDILQALAKIVGMEVKSV